MHRHIAHIDIVQSRFFAYLAGSFERFQLRVFVILHFVVRMECAQMPGNMLSKIIGNEFGHLFQVFVAVIFSGYDKRGHFNPNACFVSTANILKHRFQPSFAQCPVKFFSISLQIDVHGINGIRE